MSATIGTFDGLARSAFIAAVEFLIGAGDAHDVDAGFLEPADLVDRGLASPVSVLVIVCTVIGASPPTGTGPT